MHFIDISCDKPVLYVKIDMVEPLLKARLAKYIYIEPIEKIKEVFNDLKHQTKIGFDFKNSSYFFYDLAIKKNCVPSHLENPCLIPKASKNVVELEGARKAHVRDGVSVTKFLHWLKNHQNIENENKFLRLLNYFHFVIQMIYFILSLLIQFRQLENVLFLIIDMINNPIPLKRIQFIYLTLETILRKLLI